MTFLLETVAGDGRRQHNQVRLDADAAPQAHGPRRPSYGWLCRLHPPEMQVCGQGPAALEPCSMRFGSTAKVPAECNLTYYGISECPVVCRSQGRRPIGSPGCGSPHSWSCTPWASRAKWPWSAWPTRPSQSSASSASTCPTGSILGWTTQSAASYSLPCIFQASCHIYRQCSYPPPPPLPPKHTHTPTHPHTLTHTVSLFACCWCRSPSACLLSKAERHWHPDCLVNGLVAKASAAL